MRVGIVVRTPTAVCMHLLISCVSGSPHHNAPPRFWHPPPKSPLVLFNMHGTPPPPPPIHTGELDEDDEGGGIKMSAQGRVALMSRLAGSHGMRTPATHVTAAGLPAALPVPGQLTVDSTLLMKQGILGPSSPIATPCLLLKNMFEPAGQGAGPGELAALAAEVVADVRDEGSRFGELVHVWADARSRVSDGRDAAWGAGVGCWRCRGAG